MKKKKVPPGKHLVIADERNRPLCWTPNGSTTKSVLVFTTYEKIAHFTLVCPFVPEAGQFLEISLQELADKIRDCDTYILDVAEPEDLRSSLPLPARRTAR